MPSADHAIPLEAYDGTEPYLFVSYAHKDSEHVLPEIELLHERGYRVWYDEGIDPGNEWPEMIANALDGCTQFLVFVSPNAVASQNVRNEINFAINRGKAFLAVHIEETALPTGLELRMGDIQAILKYRMDSLQYLRQLARALRDGIRKADKPPIDSLSSDALDSSEADVERPILKPKSVVVNEHKSPIDFDSLADEQAVSDLATSIAIDGCDEALKEFTFARFGGMDVVEPDEVSDFLDLHRMIYEYQKQPQRVPLSVAIFSPPGTPKVFCVQQVVDTVLPRNLETCTFNLSTLDSKDELYDAFDFIRDIGSKGKIPLVMWENFDYAQLSWLRQFNPILESGSYRSNKTQLQIGNAIFAFLSEGYPTLDTFLQNPSDPKRMHQFVAAGGPDFASCLKGFLNIRGVNSFAAEHVSDRGCAIRRAVWLRHCLRRRTPWLFTETSDRFRLNIELEVLNAFLQVAEYRHGFRSMESIVQMSALAGKSAFQSDSLPSHIQILLHASNDFRDFRRG